MKKKERLQSTEHVQEKEDFYSLDNILKYNARYNMIYGERSNGKTYAVLLYAYKKWLKDRRSELAIIRRMDIDFSGASSMKTCYNSLMRNANDVNMIEQLSDGEFIGVYYYSGCYYLTAWDEREEREVRTDNIIARAFPLNTYEHSKSSSVPNVKTILFDEFMTRNFYLSDEFVIFQNVVSTIRRKRMDVEIFMCANTVNKYGCPYFEEMGLFNIKNMVQGQIDYYEYGDSGLTVAVQYCDTPNKDKGKKDPYFAFDNPKLQMITSGDWEMMAYPHCPVKYTPQDIQFIYFIAFDEQLLQCEVVCKGNDLFTYIHRKTTPIRYKDDLIYSVEYSSDYNRRRDISKPFDEIGKKIWYFFQNDKVFYQTNEVGEIVRSFINSFRHEGM